METIAAAAYWLFNHYREEPGRLLGAPFAVIAALCWGWLIYDYFRRRRRQALQQEREKLWQAAKAQEKEIAKIVHEMQRLDKLARRLNEVRERLGLPSVDVFDSTSE